MFQTLDFTLLSGYNLSKVYFFCFLNLQFIIIKIFLPFDNLKIEYSLYQDCRCNTKDNN